jgi:hypothetical protein
MSQHRENPPGLGGHCISIGPFYLTWKAREYDFSTRFIQLAGGINTSIPYFVVQRAAEVLSRPGQAPSRSPAPGAGNCLQAGRGRQPGVSGQEDHPPPDLGGAQVSYNYPHIPRCAGRQHDPGYDLRWVELTPEVLRDANLPPSNGPERLRLGRDRLPGPAHHRQPLMPSRGKRANPSTWHEGSDEESGSSLGSAALVPLARRRSVSSYP